MHLTALSLDTLDPASLSAILDGRAPRHALITASRDVVMSSVTRVLAGGRRTGPRPLREEAEDVTQDVLMEIFADQGRVLRQWDPAKGRSLRSFVRLVAQRRAIEWSRSAARRGALEDPMAQLAVEPADDASTPEQVVAAGDVLRKLLGALQRELTPKGWMIFHELFLDEREIASTSASLAMEPGALWAWRSRLASRSRALAADLVA